MRSFVSFSLVTRSIDPYRVLRWGSIIAVGLMFVGVAGCASGIETTKVGREMQNSQSASAAGILGDAVFSVVKGMTIEKVIATLSMDGASRKEISCSWTFTDSETAWDRMGVRPPGPLRSWVSGYHVEFAASVIDERSNVTSTVTSRKIK